MEPTVTALAAATTEAACLRARPHAGHVSKVRALFEVALELRVSGRDDRVSIHIDTSHSSNHGSCASGLLLLLRHHGLL